MRGSGPQLLAASFPGLSDLSAPGPARAGGGQWRGQERSGPGRGSRRREQVSDPRAALRLSAGQAPAGWAFNTRHVTAGNVT